MSDELIRLTATEVVSRLRSREISPLELIDAAAARIAAVEPAVNALPTLCLDRARDHAKRLMNGQAHDAESEPGWLAGLPVAIKDLTDVAGVRTTYGSPIFRDHVPARSHPVVERIERKGGVVVAKSIATRGEDGPAIAMAQGAVDLATSTLDVELQADALTDRSGR